MTPPTAPAPSSSGLFEQIQYSKGVGPQKAELLAKLGIRTVEDVLFHFPRDHQDRRVVRIKDLKPGEKCAFLVEVVSADFPRVGKMLGQARALLRDASGTISGVWFKHLSFRYDVFAGLKRDLVPGRKLLVYGLIEVEDDIAQLKVEDHEMLAEGDTVSERIVPVYPLTDGINDRWLRGLAQRVVEPFSRALQDPLPASLRQVHALPPLDEAVRNYHFPPSLADRDRARHRLAFDEFFLLELALALNRQDRELHARGQSSQLTKKILSPFRSNLGYEFTKAQARTINEIFRDMERPTPMHRLLQGDVGSGKTVVALSAALLAVENGRQAAFLAPTEILAGQHAITISKLVAGLKVRVEVFTGSMARSEKTKILKRLKEGQIDILVGTHAILNAEVQFKELGLVVIDEQHRFGVRQRERLMTKPGQAGIGEEALIEKLHPDVLIMTATPIPRTLALTLYGDLDVSVIDELPAGRAPIRTSCQSAAEAMARIERGLEEGRQAYIVFPLVEESANLAKKGKTVLAATQEFERLKQRFPGRTLELLHGQMSPEDKRTAMERFRSGAAHILVATPVIEVGIDVPNATVIAIMNPERFGLAQLHQLRGRVGRGKFASECVLVTETPEQADNARLGVFCVIADGFSLAEEDLKLRGPGEVLGESQHGIPMFRVGNILKDGLLIGQAREAARSLVAGEIALTLREHGILNRALNRRFGSKIQLSRIG